MSAALAYHPEEEGSVLPGDRRSHTKKTTVKTTIKRAGRYCSW
jgi:hypothetical protein